MSFYSDRESIKNDWHELSVKLQKFSEAYPMLSKKTIKAQCAIYKAISNWELETEPITFNWQ